MPRGARGGDVEVRFDADEVRTLVKDLKELEGGKQLAAALRRNLKAAAQPIARQVRSNASWSSRIPGAVTVGKAFTAKRTGVFLRVNQKKAPHARAFENQGKSGTFRHRVFGKDVWVAQQARPFFFNETARHLPDVEKAAVLAVDEAARAAGFRD